MVDNDDQCRYIFSLSLNAKVIFKSYFYAKVGPNYNVIPPPLRFDFFSANWGVSGR